VLKSGYRIRDAADLETGKAKIVLDDGVGWLQKRCFAQRHDSIGRSSRPEELGRQCKQSREALLRVGRA
jgi:hypothetical protein